MRHLRILYILLFLVSPLSAQNINFSSSLMESNDSDIKAIMTLWEDYIEACRLDIDSLQTECWSESEADSSIKTDIIKYSFGAGDPLYCYGDIFTYGIQKVDTSHYQIYSAQYYKDDFEESTVFATYKICAKEVSPGIFKLFNYFDINRDKLKVYNTGSITYYYPDSYHFDKEKASKSEHFVDRIFKEYKLDKSNIIYILGNTLTECNSIIGFDYTIANAPTKFAAYSIYPNILLATQIDHSHELIHGVFRPNFPTASFLFQEGIATYYGGSANLPYQAHLNIVKDYIESHPDMNLSDFESYNTLIDEQTNPFYIVGALIIDSAIKTGGEEKVSRLLERYTDDNFDRAFNDEFGLQKEDIHTFILSLINNS